MNAYNRQTSLTSLTSGFQSFAHVDSPTAGQHDANGKQYTSWTDVKHAMDNQDPVSVVVLGSESVWSCHVLVHMFRNTCKRELILAKNGAHVDEVGFVFHNLILSDERTEYDSNIPVFAFALMLPIQILDTEQVSYCIINKNWSFVDTDLKWTIIK